jgi:hypothetical protein
MAKKGPREITVIKNQVINKLIKSDCIYWARDLKILKGLLVQYPDLEFWKNISLGFQLNSLAWFITPDGKKRLDEDYKMFHLKAPVNIEFKIDSVKYGDDAVIIRKPKTLQELFKQHG